MKKSQQNLNATDPPNQVFFRRAMKYLFIISMLFLITAVLTYAVLPYGRNLPGFSRNLSTFVTLSHPANGAILPLHGTYTVQGEATSRNGVSELQLIVNGQPWGSKGFEFALSAVQGNWQWTPSGEGIHDLFVRAIDGSGRVAESNHVRIVTTRQADIRFPLQYSVEEGDTVNSLAERAGVDPQEITDANPGVDPEAPLTPSFPLTIPIHVPNAPPSKPESGAPPAPPIDPLPASQEDPAVLVQAGVKLILGDKNDDSAGFVFIDGKVVPAKVVDKLYLYVSVDHETPWQRIPDQPMTFLSPQKGGFDISDYLDLAALEASPTPISLDAEAWGWQGGGLVFLGSYHGMLGGGLSVWPPKNTELKIAAYETLGKPTYTQDLILSGEDPNLSVDFDWLTSAPNASFGRWQISTKPFQGDNLFPSGLVQQGVVIGSEGRFSVDFDQYFNKNDSALSDLFDPVGEAINAITGKEKPLKYFWSGAPLTFYVRILPLEGSTPFAVQPTGTPSNMVVVRYLPSGEVLAEGSTPGGPVYETHIAEFIPYRPADPAYKSCMVLTEDLHFGLSNDSSHSGFSWIDPTQSASTESENKPESTWPAGTLSCGCPGVSCSGGGGGSSCSLYDPGSWLSDCPQELIEGIGSGLGALVEFGANLYNGAKKFVVDTLSSGLCNENFLGAVMSEGDCKTLVNAGVNAGLAAMGLPPEIPNFEQLFNEGLEYAVATLASEITGFECDETCRNMLKKAYEGISDPEKLYQEGLQYGASLAADELNDLGLECDAKCESLIQEGMQGNIDLSTLTDEALNKLAEEAANKLNEQGYNCDEECQKSIKDSLEKGYSLGEAVVSSGGPPQQQPLWVAHPLAVDQPAIAKIDVFRRWESAQLDPAIVAERCSGFSLDNSATNNMYSMPLSGRLFEPRSVEMPFLEPGGSFRVPVVLDHATWFLPEGFSDTLDPYLLGYQDLGTEGGEPIGQVQQGLGQEVPFDDNWRVLYYGSQVELNTFGPFMLDVIDGQSMSFPCFSEDGQKYNIAPH